MRDEYPNAGAYTDRHGRTRWRFRRAGRTVSLPHAPGHPEFEEAYAAAVEGRARKTAAVVRHPGAAQPRSLRAAWRMVPTSLPEWGRLDPETRARQDRIAEAFLRSRIVEGDAAVWADMPVADMRRRHVKMILAERGDTPHAARHLLTVLRRMILVALDEEWIESDPTYKVRHRPAYVGWKAWPDEARAQFEAKWPLGSTPRLAYALALWLGNRRGDVATLPVSAIDGDKVRLTQGKTGRALVLGITPMLREALDAADLTGPTVLRTAYGEPFSAKSLTGRMADWTRAAGLPPGHTLHGLRKTLGKMLAEGGSTTRQIMDTLGHTDIKHAELYSREAEQERLARAGMNNVARMENRRISKKKALG
jgi:integrase